MSVTVRNAADMRSVTLQPDHELHSPKAGARNTGGVANTDWITGDVVAENKGKEMKERSTEVLKDNAREEVKGHSKDGKQEGVEKHGAYELEVHVIENAENITEVVGGGRSLNVKESTGIAERPVTTITNPAVTNAREHEEEIRVAKFTFDTRENVKNKESDRNSEKSQKIWPSTNAMDRPKVFTSPPALEEHSMRQPAIDHHSHHMNWTAVGKAPHILVDDRDCEEAHRMRVSDVENSGKRQRDSENEHEREKDRDRDRESFIGRLGREYLQNDFAQYSRHAREAARKLESQHNHEGEHGEHERRKERTRGSDKSEVTETSAVHVLNSSAHARRPDILQTSDATLYPGNNTHVSRRERVEMVSQPSIITIPAGSSSVSINKLGVLKPRTCEYQPLKEMEFRLIKILPERMSILKTELLHYSLHDTLDYVAISYAWGDGMDSEELFVDGAKVSVAASLYHALKAVRQKKNEILVWADALCIDQKNAEERATQVRLMGTIYSKATSVAVWLGLEADESELAMDLLQCISNSRATPRQIRINNVYSESAALFTLFKREYWTRLWCVQEVLLAKQIMVYCGDATFPWNIYKMAAEAFWDSDSDVHARQGPSSFPDKDALMQLGHASLLEVMRTCRKQLSENPRDKVFGILGLLPMATQREFPIDYSQSVKTVYTDVVDYVISTTDQLDVIRESIHFPIHSNSAGLPSWCPDWSHIPQVAGLGRTLGFDASKGSEAWYKFHDKRRKLEIHGIKLDVIKTTGITVGTFCSSQDYLMAFMHWRAILLGEITAGENERFMQQVFCRTLCLGQVPDNHVLHDNWHNICYHIFASLTRERLPHLELDPHLLESMNRTGLIEPDARRKFLQVHFGNRMMGRSFCVTENGIMGMGSGYMTVGDLIVVAFGCSTPILLRPEGRRNEYRYIGDIYVDGCMHGEVVAGWEKGWPGWEASKYMLC